MGGLGEFNGSYEEYAILPVQKVFHISSNLTRNILQQFGNLLLHGVLV